MRAKILHITPKSTVELTQRRLSEEGLSSIALSIHSVSCPPSPTASMPPIHDEKSAILYQNTSKTVILLDIPRSIALAQSTSACACSKMVFSSPAPSKPWPSTEPKSEKAKANIVARGMISKSKLKQETLVQTALEELHDIWRADWCLERKISSGLQESTRDDQLGDPGGDSGPQRFEPLVLTKFPVAHIPLSDLRGRPIHNSSSDTLILKTGAASNHEAMSSTCQANHIAYIIPVGHAVLI